MIAQTGKDVCRICDKWQKSMGRGKHRAAAICRAGSAAGTEAEAGGHKSHLQHIALQSENLTREELTKAIREGQTETLPV